MFCENLKKKILWTTKKKIVLDQKIEFGTNFGLEILDLLFIKIVIWTKICKGPVGRNSRK